MSWPCLSFYISVLICWHAIKWFVSSHCVWFLLKMSRGIKFDGFIAPKKKVVLTDWYYENFNAATNGYLIDDSCVFGVEVFEVKDTGIGETIKMIEDPLEVTFDWKVCEFSRVCKEKLNGENLISEEFTIGKSKW